MARRLFNGRQFSEDGWPYVDQGSCKWFQVAAGVSMQIQEGVPFAVLGAFARDYHEHVEPIFDRDCCSWTPGNSVATSNHPGGTACDIRWDSHPFQKRGSFTRAQLATIQELLDFYELNVFWAGIDWSEGGWGSPIDEMHWQMGYGTYDQKNDRPSPKVLDFVARKIRADGFSTFRRGNAPVSAAPILAAATGLPEAKAEEILPTMRQGLKLADCTNPRRIAMFYAQTGHESANFNATEEYASGAAYEGRIDLGNSQPGDGVRFKGRTWIQITGRHNYGQFSKWAFDNGLVPTPTYFVDHPTELSDLKWAGTGAAWYWTVARPDINALSDAGDVVTVTRRINGGTNGLDDRQARYSRAIALGDQLLTILTGEDDFLSALSNDEQRLLFDRVNQIWGAEFNPVESTSIYANPTPGDPGNMWASKDLPRNDDGFAHEDWVEKRAKRGDGDALRRIVRAAAGKGRYTDAAAINNATAVLAEIEKSNPEVLQNYLNGVNA